VDHVIAANKRMLFKDFVDVVKKQLDLANATEFARTAAASSSMAPEDVTNDDWPPLDRFRIRNYNVSLKCGADTYDIVADGDRTLDALQISAYRPLMVEARREDQKFEEFYVDGVGICLDEFDVENDCFLPPRRLRLKKSTTPAELIDLIATWTNYPKDEILLLKCTPHNFQDARVDIIPYIHNKTLKDDYYINDYVKVIYQRMEEMGDAYYQRQVENPEDPALQKVPINRKSYVTSFTTSNGTIVNVPENEPAHRSKAVACYMNIRCKLNIKLNKPPSNTFSHQLVTDARSSVGSLRAEVAKLLGLDVTSIRMLKSSFNGFELKDDNLKVGSAGLYDNMCIAIMVGQVLSPGNYMLMFYRYNPGIDTKLVLLPNVDDVSSPARTNEAIEDISATIRNISSTVKDTISKTIAETMSATVKATMDKHNEAVEKGYNVAGGYYDTWQTGSDDEDETPDMIQARQAALLAAAKKNMAANGSDGITKSQGAGKTSNIEAIEVQAIDCLTPVVEGDNANIAMAVPVEAYVDGEQAELVEVDMATGYPATAVSADGIKVTFEAAAAAPNYPSPNPIDENEKSAILPPTEGTIEPNDFAERTTQQPFGNAHFTQIPELDGLVVSDSTLVRSILD
jgi:hypothetical protein